MTNKDGEHNGNRPEVRDLHAKSFQKVLPAGLEPGVACLRCFFRHRNF